MNTENSSWAEGKGPVSVGRKGLKGPKRRGACAGGPLRKTKSCAGLGPHRGRAGKEPNGRPGVGKTYATTRHDPGYFYFFCVCTRVLAEGHYWDRRLDRIYKLNRMGPHFLTRSFHGLRPPPSMKTEAALLFSREHPNEVWWNGGTWMRRGAGGCLPGPLFHQNVVEGPCGRPPGETLRVWSVLRPWWHLAVFKGVGPRCVHTGVSTRPLWRPGRGNDTQPLATTRNHSQPLAPTRNHSQPLATTRNHTGDFNFLFREGTGCPAIRGLRPAAEEKFHFRFTQVNKDGRSGLTMWLTGIWE
ncbi:MAG: hypothetical protein JWR26_4409 [Pedosphaera sp.]|nr:hypothetical protein [Pedosphaera sp.]